MGQMADDIIDGTCCQLCSYYFDDPEDETKLYTHDYPVVCWDCREELTEEERKQYQKALVE